VEARQLRHAASATSRHVTVSVGVATTQAVPGQAPEVLVQAAEHALDEAKAAGRNRIAVQVLHPSAEVNASAA